MDYTPEQLLFDTSVLFAENYDTDADILVNQGGTSSGKTYTILQVLFTIAVNNPKSTITIVGQDYPNLRVGPIRQCEEIVEDSKILQSLIAPGTSKIKLFNEGSKSYVLKNRSRIEFKSYMTAQGAKSGKRDYLFVNEANGIPEPIFFELQIRTKVRTWIDYNPNAEFWVHESYIGKKGVKLIISDHRHNPFLPEKMHEKIEDLKHKDPELYRVYGRGKTGKITGLILPNHFIVDDIPEGAKLVAHGMDFGYANDPTFYGSMYMFEGELYLDELLYETGLLGPDIAKRVHAAGYVYPETIIADSAEQRLIAELELLGLYIEKADKPGGSVNAGIDILKRYRINITRRSVNLRKEFQNYIWKVDRAGKPLNEPVDAFNHGIDAFRYVALRFLKITGNGEVKITKPKKKQVPTTKRGMFAGYINK